jgi:putative transposase
MDLTEDGRRLKMMPVVDEYTRECLSIDVERSITAEDVVATLASLFRSRRSEPAFIRAGLRSRVHRQSREAVAGSLRG